MVIEKGVARGCGRQKICMLVNLGAYYLVGLPCAIVLTFVYNFGGKVMLDFLFILFFSLLEAEFVEFVFRVCGSGSFVGAGFRHCCF